MDTHALILALHALQMEIRAHVLLGKDSSIHHALVKALQIEADRLMEEAEKAAWLVEDWEATAEVESNPELVAKLRAPRSKKKYHEWKP